MGKLVHFLDDGTTKEIKLDRERITIGRRPDNDLCLPQPPVSGEHAVVVTILADSFLEDLGSTNGTLVNGKAVTKHFLRDRDEIDIGRQVLVYLVDDAAKLEGRPRHEDVAHGPQAGKGPEKVPAPIAAIPAVHDGAQHGKRRSDGQANASDEAVDAIQQFVAAEIGRGTLGAYAAPPGAAEIAGTVPALAEPESLVPAVRVLSGPYVGRVLSLAKSETLVGRAGVQVAALRRTDDEIRIVPVEGTKPSVNGAPVAAEGRTLAGGDIVEIAGARLELLVPGEPPA